MAFYNMTGWQNASNTFQLFEAVNNSSSGALAWMSLVTVFIIMLALTYRRNSTLPMEGVTASAMTALVWSVILVSLGLLGEGWLIATTVVAGIAGVGLYMQNKT